MCEQRARQVHILALQTRQRPFYTDGHIPDEYVNWGAFENPWVCRVRGCAAYGKDFKLSAMLKAHLKTRMHVVRSHCCNYKKLSVVDIVPRQSSHTRPCRRRRRRRRTRTASRLRSAASTAPPQRHISPPPSGPHLRPSPPPPPSSPSPRPIRVLRRNTVARRNNLYSYYILIVFLLYSYCILIVFLLCSYCIVIGEDDDGGKDDG